MVTGTGGGCRRGSAVFPCIGSFTEQRRCSEAVCRPRPQPQSMPFPTNRKATVCAPSETGIADGTAAVAHGGTRRGANTRRPLTGPGHRPSATSSDQERVSRCGRRAPEQGRERSCLRAASRWRRTGLLDARSAGKASRPRTAWTAVVRNRRVARDRRGWPRPAVLPNGSVRHHRPWQLVASQGRRSMSG